MFLGRRKRSSQEFYGRCVSQFVTITSEVKYVTDPDIMVFITYPMVLHLGPYVRKNIRKNMWNMSMCIHLLYNF